MPPLAYPKKKMTPLLGREGVRGVVENHAKTLPPPGPLLK